MDAHLQRHLVASAPVPKRPLAGILSLRVISYGAPALGMEGAARVSRQAPPRRSGWPSDTIGVHTQDHDGVGEEVCFDKTRRSVRASASTCRPHAASQEIGRVDTFDTPEDSKSRAGRPRLRSTSTPTACDSRVATGPARVGRGWAASTRVRGGPLVDGTAPVKRITTALTSHHTTITHNHYHASPAAPPAPPPASPPPAHRKATNDPGRWSSWRGTSARSRAREASPAVNGWCEVRWVSGWRWFYHCHTRGAGRPIAGSTFHHTSAT